MKRIYIDDLVHQQLKKEAKSSGRTLQYIVEERLTSKVGKGFPRHIDEATEPIEFTIVDDSQEWSSSSEQPAYNKPKSIDDLMGSGLLRRGV